MTDPFDKQDPREAEALSWRVVFCDPEPVDPDRDGWWERLFHRLLCLLKPGFRHCFLMRRLTADAGGSGGWLIVNPHSARLDILEVADTGSGENGYGAHVAHLAGTGRVHVLDVPQLYPSSLALRPWFSCVEVVKHVTGLKPPRWVVTPGQLYDWVRRYGPA